MDIEYLCGKYISCILSTFGIENVIIYSIFSVKVSEALIVTVYQ